MDVQLFNQRIKNIVDAAAFKEPEKVPVGFEGMYWQYGLAGATLKELNEGDYTFEEHVERYCRYLDEIEFDYTMNIGGYEAYDAYLALGSDKYPMGRDDCTVQHNQVGYHFMTDEEYELLIAEPAYFMNEYWPKRNVPAFKEPRDKAYAMLKEAAKCVRRSADFESAVCKVGVRDYSIVPVLGMTASGPLNEMKAEGIFDQSDLPEELQYGSRFAMYMSTLDNIHDTYRGMLDTFADLSDNRDTLDAAIVAINRARFEEFKKMPPQVPEPNALPMCGCIFHISAYISLEDQMKYWFEDFRRMLLPWAEAGKKIYMKGEGSFMHVLEPFREFPKGSIIIQLDSDDPFEAKKVIGDHQVICGGFPLALLHLHDLQKCKDQVDRCFNELAPGGGYMFNMDKPLLSPSDGDIGLLRDLYGYINEKAKK